MRLQVRNTRQRDGEHLWKTVDEYHQTYWSGLDARVYAGNIFLDELVSLQYEVQEAVLPLFGYADYTYRSVVHGARRVQGAFMLNYRREGYLFDLLRQLQHPTPPPVATGDSPDHRAVQLAQQGDTTLEEFLALVSPGGKQGRGQTRIDPNLLQQSADAFTQAIWGRGVATPSLSAQAIQAQVNSRGPRFAVPGGFDLRITFGSANRDLEPAAERTLQGNGEFHNTPFPHQVTTEGRLVKVALTGCGRVLDDSGRTVMENYSFIAQDLL